MRKSSCLALGSLGLLLSMPLACGGEDDSGLGSGGSAGVDAGSGGSGGSSASGGTSGTGGSSATGGTGGAGGGAGTSGSAGGGGTGGAAGSAGGTAGSAGAAAGGSAGSAGAGTGGTAGIAGGSGTGGKGGSGGAGGMSCNQLQGAYAKALAEAKTCNPFISVLQCTQKVDDELACPCPTFINPQNTAAAKTLSDLGTQWLAQSCHVGIVCPAVLCPEPSNAVCVPGGGSGSCKDNLATP